MHKTLAAVLLGSSAWLMTSVGLSNELGLPVGAKAPEFTLPDQKGDSHQLSDLVKSGNVALVFFRSAEW